MWLYDLLANIKIEGFGSELSSFTLALVAVIGFFIRRRAKSLAVNREKKKSSGAHKFEDQDMLAAMIDAYMKKRE